MYKSNICLIFFLFAFGKLSFGQTEFNTNIKTKIKTEQFKRHSVGLGLPLLILAARYPIVKLMNLQPFQNAEKWNLKSDGFLNLALTYEYRINKKFSLCNYTRLDFVGPKKKSVETGVNFYPTINYGLLNGKLKIGLGASVMIGTAYVLDKFSDVIHDSTKYILAFPLIHFKFNIIEFKNSNLSIMNYTGYAYFERIGFGLRNPTARNIVISSNTYGGNITIGNFFTNLIGINYEITF
jgi:hypothetical protein